MNFGNLGFMEILIILLLVLLLFGAKRLPEIGSSMGRGIREFKKSISDMDRSISEGARDESRERLRPMDETPVARTDEEARPEPKRLLS